MYKTFLTIKTFSLFYVLFNLGKIYINCLLLGILELLLYKKELSFIVESSFMPLLKKYPYSF